MSFVNSDGKVETWEFQDGTFTSAGSWLQKVSRKEFDDINDKVDLAVDSNDILDFIEGSYIGLSGKTTNYSQYKRTNLIKLNYGDTITCNTSLNNPTNVLALCIYSDNSFDNPIVKYPANGSGKYQFTAQAELYACATLFMNEFGVSVSYGGVKTIKAIEQYVEDKNLKMTVSNENFKIGYLYGNKDVEDNYGGVQIVGISSHLNITIPINKGNIYKIFGSITTSANLKFAVLTDRQDVIKSVEVPSVDFRFTGYLLIPETDGYAYINLENNKYAKILTDDESIVESISNYIAGKNDDGVVFFGKNLPNYDDITLSSNIFLGGRFKTPIILNKIKIALMANKTCVFACMLFSKTKEQYIAGGVSLGSYEAAKRMADKVVLFEYNNPNVVELADFDFENYFTGGKFYYIGLTVTGSGVNIGYVKNAAQYDANTRYGERYGYINLFENVSGNIFGGVSGFGWGTNRLFDLYYEVYEAKYVDLLQEQQKEEGLIFMRLVFDKIHCIGDSLTFGAPYDRTNEISYPVYLAKLSGWNVTHKGMSGWTTLQYWNAMKNSNPGFKTDFSDVDTLVIWLGQNGGLTDTLDVDVNPYDDYHNYADTNTGAYCKIIEFARSTNPKLHIFCCTLTYQYGHKIVSNEVVHKIAEKYGLDVIDLKNNGFYNLQEARWHLCKMQSELTGFDDCHFDTIGYMNIAQIIMTKMCKAVYDNPERYIEITNK